MVSASIDERENIFILSGPSGCGKNTAYEELQKKFLILAEQ